MLKVVILERKLWSETSIMVYLSLFSEVTNLIFQIFNTTYKPEWLSPPSFHWSACPCLVTHPRGGYCGQICKPLLNLHRLLESL